MLEDKPTPPDILAQNFERTWIINLEEKIDVSLTLIKDQVSTMLDDDPSNEYRKRYGELEEEFGRYRSSSELRLEPNDRIERLELLLEKVSDLKSDFLQLKDTTDTQDIEAEVDKIVRDCDPLVKEEIEIQMLSRYAMVLRERLENGVKALNKKYLLAKIAYKSSLSQSIEEIKHINTIASSLENITKECQFFDSSYQEIIGSTSDAEKIVKLRELITHSQAVLKMHQVRI